VCGVRAVTVVRQTSYLDLRGCFGRVREKRKREGKRGSGKGKKGRTKENAQAPEINFWPVPCVDDAVTGLCMAACLQR